MSQVFNCLGCGHMLHDDGGYAGRQVVPCPKCGRDMYRAAPSNVPAVGQPSQFGGAMTPQGFGGSAQPLAVPSRYAAVAGARPMVDDFDEDDETNSAILVHTPLVAIVGFIFSFVPFLCWASVFISIVALNLINSNPKGYRGKPLAIAALAISGVMSIVSIVLYINIR